MVVEEYISALDVLVFEYRVKPDDIWLQLLRLIQVVIPLIPMLMPPPLARPAWQVLGVLLAGLGDGDAPASAASAFLRLGQLYDPFAGLSYETLGARGALLNEPVRIAGGAR